MRCSRWQRYDTMRCGLVVVVASLLHLPTLLCYYCLLPLSLLRAFLLHPESPIATATSCKRLIEIACRSVSAARPSFPTPHSTNQLVLLPEATTHTLAAPVRLPHRQHRNPFSPPSTDSTWPLPFHIGRASSPCYGFAPHTAPTRTRLNLQQALIPCWPCVEACSNERRSGPTRRQAILIRTDFDRTNGWP